VEDRRVKAGGCVIDTKAGSIDAQIETQLSHIKSAFAEAEIPAMRTQGDGLTPPSIDLAKYHKILANVKTIHPRGAVIQVIGLTIEAEGLSAEVGELCIVHSSGGKKKIPAEVVGFRGDRTLLMPLGEIEAIHSGSPVEATGSAFRVQVGSQLLGRVLDGLGRPIDGKGTISGGDSYVIQADAPHPLNRRPIQDVLPTGIRSIDGLLTVGKGQRIGIFAGSGVGKSTTLGMIARFAKADVNVLALIGERGREVQEFIQRGPRRGGPAAIVIVVSTSDQPALVRIKGAWVATTIAEYFRDQGLDVNLLMDSVTRFAMAQREVGLAIGEPPATKGYTPSVFALLPRLMERTEPRSAAPSPASTRSWSSRTTSTTPSRTPCAASSTDHVVLSRRLADENHYPAVDVLAASVE